MFENIFSWFIPRISDDERIWLENQALKKEKSKLEKNAEEILLQKDELSRMRQAVDLLLKEREEK